jgi:hypothetical protein
MGFGPAQGTIAGAVTTGAVQLAMDGVSGGSTQGAILYRNATTWVALAPGTAGQVLSSGGAGANPSWATSAGTFTAVLTAGNTSGAKFAYFDTPGSSGVTIAGTGKGDAAFAFGQQGSTGSATTLTLKANNGIGANNAGSGLAIGGGEGRGSAAGGAVTLWSTQPGSAGSSLNTAEIVASFATSGTTINAATGTIDLQFNGSTLFYVSGSGVFFNNPAVVSGTTLTNNGAVAVGSYQLAAPFADGGSDAGSGSTPIALEVRGTVNFTAATKTGHYEMLVVRAVETSLQTGSNLLLALRAGVAGTTDKFTVRNNGTTSIASGSFLTGATAAGGTQDGFGFYDAAGTSGQRINVGSIVCASDLFAATGSNVITSGIVVGDTSGNGGYGFFSTGGVLDTRISRGAAGSIYVGTGAAGAENGFVRAQGFGSAITTTSGINIGYATAARLQGGSATAFGFCSAADNGTLDVAVSRGGAAGLLQLLNPNSLTSSAEFRIYNTTDAATGAPTNSEYLTHMWSANIAYLDTVKTGSGTLRDLILGGQGGHTAIRIDSSNVAFPNGNCTRRDGVRARRSSTAPGGSTRGRRSPTTTRRRTRAPRRPRPTRWPVGPSLSRRRARRR